MDPKQSLLLMFSMRKNASEKALKRRQESIIQLLTVRYFRHTFNLESKTSLFTNPQFSNW